MKQISRWQKKALSEALKPGAFLFYMARGNVVKPS
jgi:phosphoglycerate dehydrogenase-like enzyme